MFGLNRFSRKERAIFALMLIDSTKWWRMSALKSALGLWSIPHEVYYWAGNGLADSRRIMGEPDESPAFEFRLNPNGLAIARGLLNLEKANGKC